MITSLSSGVRLLAQPRKASRARKVSILYLIEAWLAIPDLSSPGFLDVTAPTKHAKVQRADSYYDTDRGQLAFPRSPAQLRFSRITVSQTRE